MSPRAVLIIAASVLLIVGGWAAYIIGSPAHNRGLLQDRHRIELMQCLACAAKRHYGTQSALPGDKAALVAAMRDARSNWCAEYNCSLGHEKLDSELLDAIEYQLRGDKEYALCATFMNSSQAQENQRRKWQQPASKFKEYPAGAHCFTLYAQPCKNANGSEEPCRPKP
jgi:hypothetical protein